VNNERQNAAAALKRLAERFDTMNTLQRRHADRILRRHVREIDAYMKLIENAPREPRT
jgi:hypothetical protein